MKSRLSACLAAALLWSCGSQAPHGQQEGEGSILHFITFGPGVTGLTSRVKKPAMSACLRGAPTADVKAWEDKISSTILKWVKPLRALTSDKLASRVEVRVDGNGCDLDVTVREGTWSNTQIGQRPTVNMGPTGYFASYNVLLHEMGHAFGLSDTYISASGDCKPGQPQAVMCNTSFDDVQSDDVLGMKEVFRNAFPGDRPPANPEPEQPEDPKYKLFAAVGKEVSADRYQMAFSVTGGDATGALSMCMGDKASCTAAGGVWVPTTKAGDRPGAALFINDQGVALNDGAQLTIRFEINSNAFYQTISLKKEA